MLRSNLAQRTTSAVVILAVAVPLTVWGGPAFWALVLLFAGASWWEFADMGRRAGLRPFARLGGAATLGLCLLAAPAGPWRELGLAAALGALSFAALARSDYQGVAADLAYSALGVVWIGWLAGYAIVLRDLSAPANGLAWLLTALAITIGTDSGAFFAGRAVGRHLLCPRVSPNKTVEGLIGGTVGATLVGLAAGLLALHVLWWQGSFVGLASGLAAVLGDLTESLLKRQLGVKDSSRLIPGHGGVLDRIDGLLFALPVVAACVILIQSG